MDVHIKFRRMKPELEEAESVSRFVQKVFMDFVAKDYTSEGVEEFKKFIAPSKLLERNQSNHFIITARVEDKLAGIIEMKEDKHISLLFVGGEFHKKGIAKQLLDYVENQLRKTGSLPEFFTVNSTPYGFNAYERLGFKRMDEDQVVNGITFIPMKKCLL